MPQSPAACDSIYAEVFQREYRQYRQRQYLSTQRQYLSLHSDSISANIYAQVCQRQYLCQYLSTCILSLKQREASVREPTDRYFNRQIRRHTYYQQIDRYLGMHTINRQRPQLSLLRIYYQQIEASAQFTWHILSTDRGLSTQACVLSIDRGLSMPQIDTSER